MLIRLIFGIPVFGWMLRDAVRGTDESRLWFLVNVGLLWIWSGILFGYPGILIPALAAAALVLTTLVVTTAGSLLVFAPRRPSPAGPGGAKGGS